MYHARQHTPLSRRAVASAKKAEVRVRRLADLPVVRCGCGIQYRLSPSLSACPLCGRCAAAVAPTGHSDEPASYAEHVLAWLRGASI